MPDVSTECTFTALPNSPLHTCRWTFRYGLGAGFWWYLAQSELFNVLIQSSLGMFSEMRRVKWTWCLPDNFHRMEEAEVQPCSVWSPKELQPVRRSPLGTDCSSSSDWGTGNLSNREWMLLSCRIGCTFIEHLLYSRYWAKTLIAIFSLKTHTSSVG